MKVQVLREEGHYEALLGLSLSYNADFMNMFKRATILSNKDGGHNKFLESIVVWIDISAPRYFWQQFDTYRVGMTKQSESTMHTIMKEPLTQDNFEGGCNPDILRILNDRIADKNFEWVKRHLQESFIQRRIVCTNYKCIRNMYNQRRHHKLQEWKEFCNSIVLQLDHPGYITGVFDD